MWRILCWTSTYGSPAHERAASTDLQSPAWWCRKVSERQQCCPVTRLRVDEVFIFVYFQWHPTKECSVVRVQGGVGEARVEGLSMWPFFHQVTVTQGFLSLMLFFSLSVPMNLEIKESPLIWGRI